MAAGEGVGVLLHEHDEAVQDEEYRVRDGPVAERRRGDHAGNEQGLPDLHVGCQRFHEQMSVRTEGKKGWQLTFWMIHPERFQSMQLCSTRRWSTQLTPVRPHITTSQRKRNPTSSLNYQHLLSHNHNLPIPQIGRE